MQYVPPPTSPLHRPKAWISDLPSLVPTVLGGTDNALTVINDKKTKKKAQSVPVVDYCFPVLAAPLQISSKPYDQLEEGEKTRKGKISDRRLCIAKRKWLVSSHSLSSHVN